MNEFTKQQLELMEWYLKKETDIPENPYLHIYLLSKIQRMIREYGRDIYHSPVDCKNHHE